MNWTMSCFPHKHGTNWFSGIPSSRARYIQLTHIMCELNVLLGALSYWPNLICFPINPESTREEYVELDLVGKLRAHQNLADRVLPIIPMVSGAGPCWGRKKNAIKWSVYYTWFFVLDLRISGVANSAIRSCDRQIPIKKSLGKSCWATGCWLLADHKKCIFLWMYIKLHVVGASLWWAY